jgi:Family of unknown function (DUF6505)
MKRRLLRTIRLDGTDARVFERAAEPGEWAIPGGFAFADDAPESLSGKRRQAFRSGFLGLSSFGWSTVTMVAEIDDAAFDAVRAALAQHLIDAYGAPDLGQALAAAQSELEFAVGLCDGPINTLLCVEREMADDGVVERFRVVKPAAGENHARIWDLVEDHD